MNGDWNERQAFLATPVVQAESRAVRGQVLLPRGQPLWGHWQC